MKTGTGISFVPRAVGRGEAYDIGQMQRGEYFGDMAHVSCVATDETFDPLRDEMIERITRNSSFALDSIGRDRAQICESPIAGDAGLLDALRLLRDGLEDDSKQFVGVLLV